MTHKEDPVRLDDGAPLRADIRLLADTLGQVIRRLEGEVCFRGVEDLRRACRARRHGEIDAPDLQALLAQVDALPLELAAKVARAFTLFFLLINTAEQVHRVRLQRLLDRLPASPSNRGHGRRPSPVEDLASARMDRWGLRALGCTARREDTPRRDLHWVRG